MKLSLLSIYWLNFLSGFDQFTSVFTVHESNSEMFDVGGSGWGKKKICTGYFFFFLSFSMRDYEIIYGIIDLCLSMDESVMLAGCALLPNSVLIIILPAVCAILPMLAMTPKNGPNRCLAVN